VTVILVRTGMNKSKPIDTPLSSNEKLSLEGKKLSSVQMMLLGIGVWLEHFNI
jgi:hypothetical protein